VVRDARNGAGFGSKLYNYGMFAAKKTRETNIF
jgi:hypothetical protein